MGCVDLFQVTIRNNSPTLRAYQNQALFPNILLCHLISTEPMHAGSHFTIPILQVREWRHRVVKKLTQMAQLVNSRIEIVTWAGQFCILAPAYSACCQRLKQRSGLHGERLAQKRKSLDMLIVHRCWGIQLFCSLYYTSLYMWHVCLELKSPRLFFPF